MATREDEVTRRLVEALRGCGPATTRRFLRDVVGFWDAEALILLETKIGSGSLGSNQLVGHAIVGALEVPDENLVWTSEEIPPGFAVASWDHVRGWLGREISAFDDHLDPDAASHLAAFLRSEAVCAADASKPPNGTAAVPLGARRC